MKINKQTDNSSLIKCIITSILLTLLATYLYYPFIRGHDYIFHLNRITELMDAVINGNFSTYMDYKSLQGYGYASKLFYSDLLLIPYAIIGLISDNEFAFQILIFSNTILCSIFSYLAIKKITKNSHTAYLASIIYTFSSYRLIDVYIRSAVGEIFAFTFIPIIVIGMYEILVGNYRKWYILTIGMSSLIYSHLISTILVGICCIIATIACIKVLIKEPVRIKYIFIAALICIILLTYYFVPLLEQLSSNTFYIENEELRMKTVPANMHAMIWSLIDAFRLKYNVGVMTVSIGLMLVIILPLRIFIKEKNKILKLVDILMIFGIISFFCASYIYPWNVYPFSKLMIIQFPWRWFLITTFLLTIPTAYYLTLLINVKSSTTICILMTVILLICNSIYYKDVGLAIKKEDTGKTLEQLLSDARHTVVTGEYLPVKIPNPYRTYIILRGQLVKSQNNTTSITNFYKEKGHITFDTEVTTSDHLELPLTYYIGYKATLNSEKIDYHQSENGLIEVPIHESGKVEIEYVGTTLQKISLYVTIISIILLTIFVVISRRKNKIYKDYES